MWVLHNNTPLAAARSFLRDRQGGEVWIGVIQGTFDVARDGSMRLAAEQVPPAHVAEWSGGAGPKSSLLRDTDFVLSREGTDVLVHGHAYAPAGQRVSTLEVALRVGPLLKRLRVYGVRAWVPGPSASAAVVAGPARPFDKVPIVYENAFGGADPHAPANHPTCCAHNPVGKGFAHDPRGLVGQAAPQVEHLDRPAQAGPHEIAPAGFGPIAPHWMPRAGLAGTYDKAWELHQAPLLPKNFDERFYRSAPADQQLPHAMRAGETIELYHMTPEGHWRMRIPDLAFRVRAIFADQEERAGATLHTVRLWPDARRVQLVWQSRLPCHGREHKLIRAIINWEGDRTCLSPSISMG